MAKNKIEDIIKRCCWDEDFKLKLLFNREEAIEELDAPELEKEILRSVPQDQLEVIIKKIEKKQKKKSKVGFFEGASTAATIAGAAVIGGILFSSTCTLGATVSMSIEAYVRSALSHILFAENAYKDKYGQYTDQLKQLDNMEGIIENIEDDGFPYNVQIESDGQTFTIKAIHKERPKTRKAFQLGVDGKIKEIKVED